MIQETKSLAAFAVLIALVACGRDEGTKAALPAPSATPAVIAPVRVETLVVATTEVAAPVHATGTSQPIRKADLAPAMSARIEKIYVREGDRVGAGQLLVALDGRTAQLGAEQARAAAAASAAQADQLDADYQRLAPLAQRGSIATSRVEQLDSQRKAARAQARASQSAAGAASRAADNAILRAPFAGTIVSLPHEIGEMATNTTLARLIDLSKLEIQVRVSARDLGRFAVADPVTATFPQLGVTAPGTITRIGLEVDPTTSTAEVVAVIGNADGRLRGGLFTELAIAPATKRPAMVVPKSAVAGAGPKADVFAVVDGKAMRRAVEIAPFDDTRVEIVSGLAAGTRIVGGALDRVRDGAAVDPTTPVTPTSPVTPVAPPAAARTAEVAP